MNLVVFLRFDYFLFRNLLLLGNPYGLLSLQILNRTNNIFELVTVEPILTERPSDRQRNEILLSDELDSVDDRTLRLKGILKMF